MKPQALFIVIGLVAITGIVYLSAYTVDETKQAVVTRFERVVRVEARPGLRFKIPFFEIAILYPKNLQNWNGKKEEIPTLEKTYIYVDAFARWKIVDPYVFFQTVRYTRTAQDRLSEIINATVRDVITDYRLIEAVRMSNRELGLEEGLLETGGKKQETKYSIQYGREKLTKQIFDQAKPQVAELGIELVDVKIKRINYVEKVRKSVYDRMIAERNQIAEKYRSEGHGEARKILGQKEKELKEITSMAYKTAQEIKGKADAEAVRIYAKAYGKDPEFYSFTKTLEIYNTALDDKSSVVLSTDSEFFKYFKGYSDKK
jgi:membrane protease subunit HflC